MVKRVTLFTASAAKTTTTGVKQNISTPPMFRLPVKEDGTSWSTEVGGAATAAPPTLTRLRVRSVPLRGFGR